MRRHYPPAALIHVPHCAEGQDKPALAIKSVVEALGNCRLHFCFPLEFQRKPISEIAAIGVFPMVAYEKPDYGVHRYRPDKSARFPLPEDAIDFPCAVCGGTHGEDLEALLGSEAVR